MWRMIMVFFLWMFTRSVKNLHNTIYVSRQLTSRLPNCLKKKMDSILKLFLKDTSSIFTCIKIISDLFSSDWLLNKFSFVLYACCYRNSKRFKWKRLYLKFFYPIDWLLVRLTLKHDIPSIARWFPVATSRSLCALWSW